MPQKVRITAKGPRRFVTINPVARDNAKPKRSYISHGGSSALRYGPIDLRSHIGQQYKARLAELRNHIGADALTPPLEQLIDSAARLSLLCDLSWAEIMGSKDGLIKDGIEHPAISVFLRSVKSNKEILAVLGLERKTKRIPSLSEYLQNADLSTQQAVSDAVENGVLEDFDK